jgi:hypothetical protein
MDEKRVRQGLPRAYALSLWLRDLGFNEEQIASVLSVESGVVRSLLEVAQLKVKRLLREAHEPSHDPHVVVFVDGDDRLIDQAAGIARDQGVPLHLVAIHHTVRKQTFGVPEKRMQQGGLMRREAEELLLHAARRALASGVDAIPHAIAERPEDAVDTITRMWGAAVFVARADGSLSRMLARATKRSEATLLNLDNAGQVIVPRRNLSFVELRRIVLKGA